ncbi:MAG: sterol desaturase family protein [Bacteroidota bacterium]|nr:sterol desaturase family protein [Bacteroidota bacterium]
MEKLIHDFLLYFSYPKIYCLTVLYFLILYFFVGWFFQQVMLVFEKWGIAEKVVLDIPKSNQTIKEIKHSLVSVFVFGLSSFPIVYFYRIEYFTIITNNFLNVLLSLIALNIWNEIHFFAVHKLMHRPFFMKTVHKIHHQSHIPSVWSVYSFHWLEAALLSLVPFVMSLIHPLATIAIVLYPLNSILINFSGHSNYRLIGLENTWFGFASKHIIHHQKGNKNFGFLSGLLDKIVNNLTNKKQQ